MFGKSPYEHSPHIKFVDASWASGGNSTKIAGVVLLYDTLENAYKCYWGAANGDNEWEDIVHISEWGTSAPLNRTNMWFGELQDNPFSNEE